MSEVRRTIIGWTSLREGVVNSHQFRYFSLLLVGAKTRSGRDGDDGLTSRQVTCRDNLDYQLSPSVVTRRGTARKKYAIPSEYEYLCRVHLEYRTLRYVSLSGHARRKHGKQK
jgi:hypothetical protein